MNPFVRRVARTVRRHISRPSPPWVAVQENPPQPELWPGLKLFAILSTWMEADIVEATVANRLRRVAHAYSSSTTAAPTTPLPGPLWLALSCGANFAHPNTTSTSRC